MDMSMGAAPMPPQGDPMMGDPGMGGGMMQAPAPMDPMQMMVEQLQLLFAKWGQGQQQIAGEQGALGETLMMLLQAQPPTAAQAFAEPGVGQSMMGPPVEDTGMPMGDPGMEAGF